MSRRGSSLIFVLWVLIVLTALGAALGRHARAALSLTEAHVRYTKAKALAWAGVMSVVERLHDQMSHPATSESAMLLSCAVNTSCREQVDQIFCGQLEDGDFKVRYQQDGQSFYGTADEERRININAVTAQNARIVHELARLCGLTEGEVRRFLGALLKRPSGRVFETTDELLMSGGLSREAYDKLRDDLTVYPRRPVSLTINLNTASRRVVTAVVRGIIDEQTMTVEDADHLTEKILVFRAGDDGHNGTADDRAIDFSAMGLNTVEKILADKLSNYRTRQSNYLRITSEGNFHKAVVTFEAIVYRPNLAIVAWQRK